jgi:hypothetical protein
MKPFLNSEDKPWNRIYFVSGGIVILSVTGQYVAGMPAGYAAVFSPHWIPVVAGVSAMACALQVMYKRPAVQRLLRWTALLLMVWAANGLPLDLMRLTGLIPLKADIPGMITRTFAVVSVIALAKTALSLPAAPNPVHPGTWYGYAAFLLALPYPVLRIIWAFGGSLGLYWPGAGGIGFAPLVPAIPWALAAILSLMLIKPKTGFRRKFLLTSGWTATAIVAMIGPAAVWVIISGFYGNSLHEIPGMKLWIPCLFYGSWFLWFIAAGAATRSFQLRTSK